MLKEFTDSNMFREEYKINDDGKLVFNHSNKLQPKKQKTRRGKSKFATKKNESGRKILENGL